MPAICNKDGVQTPYCELPVVRNVGPEVYDVYDVVVVRPVAAVKSTTRKVRDSVRDSAALTKEKAAAVGEGMKASGAECLRASPHDAQAKGMTPTQYESLINDSCHCKRLLIINVVIVLDRP